MNLFDLRSLFEYRSKLNEGRKTHIDIQSSESVFLSKRKMVFRQKEQQVQKMRNAKGSMGQEQNE